MDKNLGTNGTVETGFDAWNYCTDTIEDVYNCRLSDYGWYYPAFYKEGYVKGDGDGYVYIFDKKTRKEEFDEKIAEILKQGDSRCSNESSNIIEPCRIKIKEDLCHKKEYISVCKYVSEIENIDSWYEDTYYAYFNRSKIN